MTDASDPTGGPVRPRRSWRMSRRTMGKSMIGVGIVGILTAVVALIAGQALVGQVESSVDDSLLLTSEALEAVDDSIEVTSSVVATVSEGVVGVRSTITTLETSLDETAAAVTGGAEFLGGTLPDALAAISEVLPTIESVASSVDSALELLEDAPFGPNYDPVKPFDESIADLTAAIEPLPAQLRALSEDFTDVGGATSAMADDVGALGDDVEELQLQLVDVGLLLDRYTATTGNAKTLAATSRDDLEQSASSTRWLLVLLAVVFASGQLVPIWLGTTLLRDSTPSSILVRQHGPAPTPED